MSVVSMNRAYEEDSSRWNNTAEREYSDFWLIETNSANDNRATVQAYVQANISPTWTDGSDADAGALVEWIEVRRKDAESDLFWLAEVHYSTVQGGTLPGSDNEDPTQRPWDVQWDTIESERIVERDLEDDLVRNSAGQRFADPLIVPDAMPVLRIQRIETTDPKDLLDKTNKTNDATFLGYEANTALIKKITGERHYEDGVLYWKVAYEIHFNLLGWRAKVLDQGTSYIFIGEVDGNPVTRIDKIVDATGHPIDEPVLLDGSGGLLDGGNDIADADGEPDGDPVFLKAEDGYLIYDETSFDALQLDYTTYDPIYALLGP